MYQNYQNPQQYPQPFNNGFNTFGANSFQSQQQKVSIPLVNGRSGAEAYNLPPDSLILLIDTTAARVWLKKTDSGGFASTEPFAITKEKDIEEQRNEALEQRLKNLEEAINAQYSDYHEVYAKYGCDSDEFYVHTAVAFWFEDKDAVKDKIAVYYNTITM